MLPLIDNKAGYQFLEAADTPEIPKKNNLPNTRPNRMGIDRIHPMR